MRTRLLIPALAFLPLVASAAPKSSLPTEYPPVPPWPGEPPKLRVVESPCPGPNCDAELATPNALGRRVIYLNFDGVSLSRSTTNDDARNNQSAIVASTMSIPKFAVGALGYSGGLTREEVIQYTIAQLEESYADLDVEFTTTRPASGNYHMILFAGEGATCENTTGASSCAGIALRDCSEIMPNNIVFVFTWGLRYADLPQVAAHEGGHALGLDHIDNNDAIMYWQIQNSIPTEFGAGPIHGPDLEDACFGVTYQDSKERLLKNIGPRGQDVLAPQVQIVAPKNGATVIAGSPVVATVSDVDSAVASLTLSINGTIVETKKSGPWEFQIPADAPTGSATIRLEATDVSGNTAASQVAVEIADDIPCQTKDQCPEGLTCGDEGTCEPEAAPGTLGAPCTANEECASGLCGSVAGESRCTQSCDAASPCPGGFECLDDVACWPADGGGGGGCSVGGNGSGPGLLLLFAAAVLGTVRRRRR